MLINKMEYIKVFYRNVTIALTPIGRVLYLPYVSMRVSFQWFQFISLLSFNYSRIVFSYYFNYLFMVQDPNSTSLSLRLQLERGRIHDRLTNSKRPIKGDEAIYMFDPPDSLFDILGFLHKTWARSDYYWDRYIVHTPFCMIGRLRGTRSPYVYIAPSDRELFQGEVDNINNFRKLSVSMYSPNETLKLGTMLMSLGSRFWSSLPGFLRPINQRNSSVIREADENAEYGEYTDDDTSYQELSAFSHSSTIESIPSMNEMQPIRANGETLNKHVSIEFEPRSYNLQPTSKEGNSKRAIGHGGSPLKELFRAPQVIIGSSISPVAFESSLSPTKPKRIIIEDNSSTGGTDDPKILYKIRIRKKPKRQDLTLNNYDLVKQEILKVIDRPDYDDGSVGPNIVRFTWHCCATYDKNTNTGGSNGATIRFPPELTDPGNTGLHNAKAYLDLVKHKFEWITYSDLYTFAGVVVIEALGGPNIPWRPGRVDYINDSKVPENGRLPVATLGIDHIKDVFMEKLGFNIQETVALIGGGHSLGRCHAQYSGFKGKWTNNPTKFDNEMFKVLLGYQWHEHVVPETSRVQFEDSKGELMMLNTDMELLKDEEFVKWCKIYSNDEDTFFRDFSDSFAKLLELGVDRDDGDGLGKIKN